MKKTIFIVSLLIYYLSVPTFISFANTALLPPANELFEEAKQAFRNKSYDKALAKFIQVKNTGIDEVSLSYNIGVCAYKLGYYSQARNAFTEVARNKKMAPLAFYNLGLIAVKEHDLPTAGFWFKKTMKTTSDPKLKKLAAAALENVNFKTASPWFGFFSLGSGYDDNIKLVYDDTQTTSGEDDVFIETMFFTRGPPLKGSSAFNLQLNAYYLSYKDLNEYNFGSGTLGLFYNWEIAGWLTETGVDYDYSFAGGDRYAQIPSAVVQLKKNIADTFLVFGYKFSYIDILDPDYDYLTGKRNRLQAEAEKKWQKIRVNAGYTLELNDRDNPDYAPTKNTVSLKIHTRPGKNWRLYAKTNFRRSVYKLSNSIDREEDLFNAGLRLSYHFFTPWTFNAEYRYDNNNCNYPIYDYNKNTGLLYATISF